MKPILPIAKHATNGFSIDSLIHKDETPGRSSDENTINNSSSPCHTSTVGAQDAAILAGRIPPLHPALPPHVRNLLLAEQSPLNNNDLLNIQRSAAWALQNSLTQPVVPLGRSLAPGPTLPTLFPGIVGTSRAEPTSLYPWMFARHPTNMFGFPYGHHDPNFFFHPYRKPKRIRTAFSPSQLLKLEHAFEKNHYVVGQERKDLAVKLNLTETQVKVWFQNRRTKYKRVRSDDEGPDDGDQTEDHGEDINVTDYIDDHSDSEGENHDKIP